jgi:hypothetical protein
VHFFIGLIGEGSFNHDTVQLHADKDKACILVQTRVSRDLIKKLQLLVFICHWRMFCLPQMN